MKIAVDATSWQNNRGYGRHARALLRALIPLDKENHYTFFMDSEELIDRVPSQAEICLVPSSAATSTVAGANSSRSLRDMWRTGRAMSAAPFQVLLFPTVYSFVPTLTKARKILFIHDTIAETYPQLTLPNRKSRLFWQAKVRLGRAQADALVTVSDYSRRSIVRHFGIAPERVFVVSEAGDPVFRPLPGSTLTPALLNAGISPGSRMITYVGGFSPHKNLAALIEAFARISTQESFGDVRLVLVGEYKKEVFHSYYGILAALVEKLGLFNRVVFTGYLADADLAVLLNHSAVLALPSLMEGFGLPAVEAAACGCPVIATKESPLPELLAGGGVFIDPHRDSLEDALKTVLGSESRRQEMATAALAAAQRLTWDAAGHQMLDVIQRVAAVK